MPTDQSSRISPTRPLLSAGEQLEAYLARLKEMERRGRESAEHRATVAEATQREWARWLELLCACARTLRARADAGDEAASLGETETPAASVLDAVHRGETRRNKLKLKLRECEATERALHARVQKIRASITQQQVRAYGFTVERGTGE